MITNKDVNKLETHFRTIFATKEELQQVKSELKSEIIALRVTLKKELKAEMTIFTNRILEAIHAMHDEIKSINTRLDSHEKKLYDQQIAIGSLNQRVQTIEFSPFK